MDKNSDLPQSLEDATKTANNVSLFRGTPHRWATASLPLAYAVACVEVVSKMSDKAGAIYHKIVEAWGTPGIKAASHDIYSLVPDSDREKIKHTLLHPETELLPDPNRPFRELEELFSGLEINNESLKDDGREETPGELLEAVEEYEKLAGLISEFITVGFNKKSDIENGRCRVIPSEKSPWLIWAVMIPTSLESRNITLERLRRFYKLRKYKSKIIDFHQVLTEKPMSRWHRRIVASGKELQLKLKNDRVFMDAARVWYECRVNYRSVAKYCDVLAKRGIMLTPKNADKQIRPCDDALGYIRRLPRKADK